ncbi:hypothetical protein C1645_829047 [Glomus cerebriforme]|uniref:Replication origin-binding protein domain-containing protein n=1 Tax=Glomus cerebriforme TaxID=658196 RepID=A0A397SRE4_9GLOM|nr:hypothetical protein C1645_829047 [Glomus cerebriforme]
MLLAQKNPGPHLKIINEATRLFSGLADLDYKPGYDNHVYFQYLSNNKNDISLTGAYHPEEIYSKYICIDGNLPLCLVLDIDARQKPDLMNSELTSLDKYKISREDLLYRILIACVDILYSDLKYFAILDAFVLAKKVANKIRKPYSEFIDIGLYKSRFNLQLLGSAKEDRVKSPTISSVKNEYHELEVYLVQPKSDYSKIWPQTFSSEKSEKDEFQPIKDETALSKGAGLVIAKYEIKHERDQLYGFLQMTEISAKPKRRIVERIGDTISNPHPLVGLSEMMISVEKLKDAPEVYPNFLARPFVAILDEANAIMRQMSSGTNAQESENAMRDVLKSARHVLAMDAFANILTLTFLQIYRDENIRVVDNKYQPHIVVMARALVEKASKLFKPDNLPIRAPYTNTVEARISFEITGHFNIVIAITNIATPIHVETLIQMLYQIHDCPRHIVSLFYQKNSNELFYPPGHENIWAELASA